MKNTNLNLEYWNNISDIWKSSDRQTWFHTYLLEPFIEDYLSTQIEQLRIMDYGCGSGELLEILSKRRVSIDGYEPAVKLWEKARSKNLCVFNTLEEVRKNKYELIILNLVLSSIEQPEKVLQSIKMLLSKDGKILISVPHPCFSLISKYHKTTKREWIKKGDYEDDLHRYFSSPVQKIFWDDGNKNFTLSFYRTVSEYVNLFKDSGLKIESIFEPKPIKSGKRHKDLYALYSSIPSFMIFILYE